MFLSPSELRTFEQLRPNPRRTFTGQTRGERLTKSKGISIEFADYRDYAHGDDLRHLDWNVLARLETPVIKTYQDELDLAVYLLLDVSLSMSFGDPSKLDAAKRLAAAFGLSALCSQDAIYRRTLGARAAPLPSLRGRAAFPKLCNWLNGIQANGNQPFSTSIREFLGTGARPGIAVILSDCMDPDAVASLRLMASRRHEVWLVHVLSEPELDPDLEGDLKLVDSENGQTVEITANSIALDLYKKNLKRHCEALAAECVRLGGHYGLFPAGSDLNGFASRILRREGWLAS